MKVKIENNGFRRVPELVKGLGEKFAIVTDMHLKELGQKLMQSMKNAGLKCDLVSILPGEQTKSLAFVEKVVKTLLKTGIKRDSAIIALGGGVIGDLTGFIASIYMRGIPYVSVPTTLLAMVDSSIGGKTGVDLEDGKNLIGTFNYPEIIIIDPLLLKTLSDREFRCGLAEIVKKSVIADKLFFNFLWKNSAEILKRNIDLVKKIIEKSINIKTSIVKKDEKESVKKINSGSSRMILNYGHTVGHALEKLSNFELSHGEAVAIGMVAENRVAVGKKILKESEAIKIMELLKKFHLPTKIPVKYSQAEIQKALSSDKKNINGELLFALPVAIGKVKMFLI